MRISKRKLKQMIREEARNLKGSRPRRRRLREDAVTRRYLSGGADGYGSLPQYSSILRQASYVKGDLRRSDDLMELVYAVQYGDDSGEGSLESIAMDLEASGETRAANLLRQAAERLGALHQKFSDAADLVDRAIKEMR